MASRGKFLSVSLLLALAVLLATAPVVLAQCTLSEGCGPVDQLTSKANGTGQVYEGDGATNNSNGGWGYAFAGANQCLSCHNDSTISSYLTSGHKNTFRKLAPNVLWDGPDGAGYLTSDYHYGSGSTYNWTSQTVSPGWCNPLSTAAQNGLPSVDASCSYPYYTQPNSNSPASYTPVADTVAAGGVRNAYYIFGGWQQYGGTSNPDNTQLGAVFANGFTGEIYPNGNFDCARCHTTGYNFDASGPEPTMNTGGVVAAIPDAQFKRIPTDGYIATGTNGTSSWYLTGVQCERCHEAAWSFGAHGSGPWQATMAENEAATALCLECHRGENVTMANSTASPAVVGSIQPQLTPKVMDHGYCSDLSGSAYATCVENSSNTWVYKPYFQHEAGATFLNSPHARFTGTLTQNAQNSSNLSVSLTGAYQSQFSENPAVATDNWGCVGCHDPHQSITPTSKLPQPYICGDCHSLAQNLLTTIDHPKGPGTPFPTGTTADIPGSCVICHMQAAKGTANSHLWRISTDSNYSTFPNAASLYSATSPQTTPNTASDGTLAAAAWLDVDLACGQCHIGGNGSVNPYGLTPPAASSYALPFTKVQLATIAGYGYSDFEGPMHPADNQVTTVAFSPLPGIYNAVQTVTLSDATSGATIYYTLDGSTPTTSSAVYTTPISVTSDITINAIATLFGDVQSTLATGKYTLQNPAPAISPNSGSYTQPQFVTISDALSSASIHYTTDGTTPTASSTLYTAPIPLVAASTTVKAIAIGGGLDPSSVTQANYSLSFTLTATPTLSPAPGSFTSAQSVTLSDTTSGAKIYYTLDGSTPTTSSTLYTAAIPIASTTTLHAIAVANGYSASTMAGGTYTIKAATPVISPQSAATFTTPVSVTITDTTSGATVYYTTDGSTPTTSSTVYTGAISVATTTTVNAIAAGGGYSPSSVASWTYNFKTATPAFSPESYGAYHAPVTVTITDTTPNATIYYTTNGSTPTTSSTVYSTPITLSTTTTLNAIAASPGNGNSAEMSWPYTITAVAPTFSPESYATYTSPVTVTITDTTPGVTIYYTTNGSTPTTSSTTYTGPITISSTTTLSAIAAGNGYGSSTVTSFTYTLSVPAAVKSHSGGPVNRQPISETTHSTQ